jgi:glycosyltransferase involved in cell wall biosynthesis
VKKVLIRGPLLTQSGYGVHSRQIFSYFLQRNDCEITTQVLPWGITPWCVNSEKDGGIYGKIMSMSKPLEQKFDLTVQIQLPHEWDPSLGSVNVGVTAGVETDKCSVEWAVQSREKMDLVIVPSSHTRLAFLNSSTGKEKTPILVVPESFFHELDENPKEIDFSFSTEKNFLTVGMFTSESIEQDRKNLLNTIVWFCQEFDGNKDVGLVVKASKGRETTIDRELVRGSIKQAVHFSGAKDPPKVYMLHGALGREEMNSLYKSKNIIGLVSSTRGEGFGLPMLEAAVAGLPVVCTGWSSITEFLSGKSFLPVDFDLVQLPNEKIDGKIFIKGAKWANPREQSFRKKIRKLYENHEELRQNAQELSEKLKSSHSQSAINKKYDEVFGRFFSV